MTPPRVCILDYGSGNVRSVYNLATLLAKNVQVSNAPDVLKDATHLVLPGVGAFASAMEKIRSRIPVDVLEEEVIRKGKPFLGICVGMQVLADRGFEFGEHAGLGWVPGAVSQLNCGDLPLPHIGWNDAVPQGEHPLFAAGGGSLDFYFVHSFAFRPAENSAVLALTEYGERFASAIRKENITGVQFHPEKSQKAGRRLLKNFLSQSA